MAGHAGMGGFPFSSNIPPLGERLECLPPTTGQMPPDPFQCSFSHVPVAGTWLPTPAAFGGDFIATQVLDFVHPQAPKRLLAGLLAVMGAPPSRHSDGSLARMPSLCCFIPAICCARGPLPLCQLSFSLIFCFNILRFFPELISPW